MIFTKEITDFLSVLNVLIVPIGIYVVRIERRLAGGDKTLKAVEKSCPIFNLGVCPNRKGNDGTHS